MPLPFERACKVAKRETVPSSPPPSRWTFESFTLDDGIVYVEHNATYGSDYLPDGHEDDPFGAAGTLVLALFHVWVVRVQPNHTRCHGKQKETCTIWQQLCAALIQ